MACLRKHAQKKKDRANQKYSINNVSLLIENKSEPHNKDFMEENPISVTVSQNYSTPSPVLCGTLMDFIFI